MDISKQCRPGLGKPWISPTGGSGLGYPKLQKLYHGYLLSVQTKYGISQILKICTYGVQTCIWFIHGIVCDNQRYPSYPWYISKHWYIPGISLVYAKTQTLINWYQIPDIKLSAAAASTERFWMNESRDSLDPRVDCDASAAERCQNLSELVLTELLCLACT